MIPDCYLPPAYVEAHDYLYFCPCCGLQLKPRIRPVNVVTLFCGCCFFEFKYDDHDSFIQRVFNDTGLKVLFGYDLPIDIDFEYEDREDDFSYSDCCLYDHSYFEDDFDYSPFDEDDSLEVPEDVKDDLPF